MVFVLLGEIEVGGLQFFGGESSKQASGVEVMAVVPSGERKPCISGHSSYSLICDGMFSVLLPKIICGKLDSITRSYWWKGDPEDRGICWASSDSLALPKRNGGLGFRNFEAF